MLIVLLLFLGFIVAGFFLYIQIQKKSQQATPRRPRREPLIRVHFSNNEPEVNTDNVLGSPEGAVEKISRKEKPLKKKLADVDEVFEIITLYLMALPEYHYNGYELLQALLASDLHYGKHNIFHRHEIKTEQKHSLFSLASVNKPGIFELSKMGNFSCPGLVLFMLLKSTFDPMAAFDAMLETACQLSEDLGGEIWDENRCALNMNKVAQIRARIRRFEESQRVSDFLMKLTKVES